MQTVQFLFIGTGALIGAFGLWRLVTIPRLYAAHASDVRSRMPVTGEVVGYEHDSEDDTYTRLIEYEVRGQRYRMRGDAPVREKGQLPVPVHLAYRRDMVSDAIEVDCDFSWDKRVAQIAIAMSAVFVVAGALG